jgi:hypothetical protein
MSQDVRDVERTANMILVSVSVSLGMIWYHLTSVDQLSFNSTK